MGRYQSIRRLIELWERYEDETGKQELSNFSVWLQSNINESPGISGGSELNLRDVGRDDKLQLKNRVSITQNLQEPMKFLEYITRVARLHDYYLKKFLEELPINSRIEYLFLNSIASGGRVKKTDLINAHLTDYTTGMDIIKRLGNNGLVVEMPDTSDRRAKILEITAQGQSVLLEAERRVNEETQMFLACTSMNKWKKTLPLFEEINDFQSEIFAAHGDKTPLELMNLMDSLKHLHK